MAHDLLQRARDAFVKEQDRRERQARGLFRRQWGEEPDRIRAHSAGQYLYDYGPLILTAQRTEDSWDWYVYRPDGPYVSVPNLAALGEYLRKIGKG